jgi:hypothetical protein
LHPLQKVAVTCPASSRGLADDDLAEALSGAGLGSWHEYTTYQPRQVSEGNAVYAANGYGLCTNYVNIFNCWDERDGLPWPLTLYVSFTRQSLLVSLRLESEAFPKYLREEGTQLLDSMIGRDNIGLYPSPAAYWDLVRQQIVELPRQARAKDPKARINLVLLGGENSTDTDFLKVLRDALRDVAQAGGETGVDGSTDNQELVLRAANAAALIDPVYAAARGMATYARRRQEVPGDCTEDSSCKTSRLTESQWAGYPQLGRIRDLR